jgi:hypothetical protein
LFCLTHFSTIAQTPAFKGIFIDTFDDIVGNTVLEDSLLHFLRDSSYNSITCYRITNVVSSVPSSTKNTTLAKFMRRARTEFGIKNILASSENFETFRNIISVYNRSRTDSLERFNYYYLEFEFWNANTTSFPSSTRHGYLCSNYLSPKGYSCDTAGAFRLYRKTLKSMDSLATVDGIRSATYVGKPNLGQAKVIVANVDLLMCDNYTAKTTSIYVNVQTRFSYFGSTSKTIQIVPIFASYSPDGPFLGDWLVKAPVGPHAEKGIYDYYFLPRFTAETASWKSKINVIGYQWYRYSGMPHNGNYNSTVTTGCNVATNLSASSITTNSAILNWTSAAGAQSYTIRYRVVGSSTWLSTSSSTNSKSLSSLTLGSTYEFQVKSHCSSSTSSAYTSSKTFIVSAVSCGVPTSISAAASSSTSITINWTGLSVATSYNIQYKKASSSTWTTTSTSALSINISSLSTATAYEYKIAMVCASGTSAYSATGTVSTLANTSTCNVPSGLFASNISTTSAKLNWTSVNGATSYTLRYRKTGTTSWTTLTSTIASYTISSLSLNTNYEFHVRTVCSSGSSAFSASSFFNTLSTSSRLMAPILNQSNSGKAANELGANSNSEISFPELFKIFPNPTNISNVQITLQAQGNEELNLVLIDMLGRVIYSETVVTNETGFLEKKLDFNQDLRGGIYQLVAYSQRKKFTSKLFIN